MIQKKAKYSSCLNTWELIRIAYRTATFCKWYLNITGIIMQSLKSIGLFKQALIKVKSYQ